MQNHFSKGKVRKRLAGTWQTFNLENRKKSSQIINYEIWLLFYFKGVDQGEKRWVESVPSDQVSLLALHAKIFKQFGTTIHTVSESIQIKKQDSLSSIRPLTGWGLHRFF
jgi:hypothetical protein